MPVTKYTLSLSSDFGGSFSSDNWVREISDSSIATSIANAAGGVSTLGDDIDTWFADTLSGADAVTFNALPASHWTVITDTTTVDVGTTLSPPTFSGNVNDYKPDGWNSVLIVRLDPGIADRDITGFDAPDPVYGRLLYLWNVSATKRVELLSDNASSVAANRILTPNGLTYCLLKGQCVMLMYDMASTRWRVLGNLGLGTLAELNTLVTDATLDDSSDGRPPSGSAGGSLGGTYPDPTVDDGADGSAIHDNAAAEISVVTLKGTPVSGDLLLIEDSADSNNKKRVTAQSIADLGGGGGTAVYADYYDVGTTDVGSSPTTLGLDTSRQSNALFVLSSDQVTVQTGGAGDYAVRYEVAFSESDSSNREVECWLEINSTEVAATRSVGSHWAEHALLTDNVLGRSAILTLADGDVIRLRGDVTSGSSGYTTDAGGVSLQIISIGANGAPGPTGPTGSGSNVIVKDDGSTVSGGPHSTLNFINCTGADAGGGVVNITPDTATPVFGQNYQTVIDTAQDTTTSSTFQTKVTLTTPSLTGTYRLGWTARVGQQNTGDKVEARLRNTTDGSTVGAPDNGIRIEPKDTNNRYSVGGFAEVVFAGSAKTFEIQWREQDGNTARIEDARIEIWRVA